MDDDGSFISAVNNGEVVGTAKMKSWCETTGVALFLIDINVLEQFRGTGITSQLLSQAETISAQQDTHFSDANLYFGANADDDQPGLQKFYESHGYSVVFTSVDMQRNLTDDIEQSRGGDFSVEPIHADQADELIDLMMRSYEGREFIINSDEEDIVEFREKITDKKVFGFLARKDSRIVGFVSAETSSDGVEVTQVSVEPDFHRQGIARSLLIHTLLDARKRGAQRTFLHTSGENVSGAKSLYESLGYEKYKTHFRYRKRV